MWTVNVDKAVDAKLKKIPSSDKARIQKAIDDLEYDPKSLDISPLVGREGYRLKVGSWRLLMDIAETCTKNNQL